MSVKKKVEKNTWEVQFYFQDHTGINKKKHKRGFRTRKEAIDWMNQIKMHQAGNLNMNFEEFVNLYYEDMGNRLRDSSMATK